MDATVADARDRAADVLAVAEESAQTLMERVGADADQLLTDAQQRCAGLVAHAERQSQQVMNQADEKARRLVDDASQRANHLIDEARQQASALQAEGVRHRSDAEEAAATITAAAKADAQRLRISAQRAAEQIRAEAALLAKKIKEEADAKATALLEAAKAEADQTRRAAQADADRTKARASVALEDAERERTAASEAAQRTRRLAEEDAHQLRQTTAEDVRRLTSNARNEANRILADARETAAAETTAAEETLAQVRIRESDVARMQRAAEELMAEANERMRRATSRTERRLERQRLRQEARARRTQARRTNRAARGATLGARCAQLRKWGRELVKNQARRVLVAGPIAAPMAVAWWSQMDYAKAAFGWWTIFAIGFAAAWELTTAFTGWMYHQARRQGDSGTIYRIMTWVFAAGAAAMNYAHHCGPGGKPTQAAVAFATMSVVGMVLWELYAALVHRTYLREQGLVSQPRPRIGLIRWVRYPVRSWTAWSLTIIDGSLTTLESAWSAAGVEIADRTALRSGLTLHRVVLLRVRTADHGPAAIPAVHCLTRVDRPGPPTVPGGPLTQWTGPDRTGGGPELDRASGQAHALERGPADRAAGELGGQTGPARDMDRSSAGWTVTADRMPAPGKRQRTTADDRSAAAGPQRNGLGPQPDGPVDRMDRTAGPVHESVHDPDRTAITLADAEQAAVNRLRSKGESLSKRSIAREIRSAGGSIASDRAGEIANALKRQPVTV
ncbi:hypothetical protein ABZ746_23515 [Streptomyces sp. NPDC020096]